MWWNATVERFGLARMGISPAFDRDASLFRVNASFIYM
jgi:hypothetical protein